MLEPLKMRLWGLVRRIFPPGRSPELAREPDEDPHGDKRSFDRYQITFPVRVSGNDAHGQPFEETTRLQDVSGSGALFLSRFPDRYHVGQELDIAIVLDAAKDVRACIRNAATVVRIHPPEAMGAAFEPGLEGIAVNFCQAFDFQRMASEENGCPK